MINDDNTAITTRFFDALHLLKERGVIRGKQTFTRRYGINRWNLNTLQKSPERGIFQPCWLMYLTRDYGVSAKWLLTGEGAPFPNSVEVKAKQ